MQISIRIRCCLYDKKFEYLHSVLIKWAGFFVGDRGVFKVFIHKENIKKYCFELQLLTSIQIFNLSWYIMDGILNTCLFYLALKYSTSIEKIVLFRFVQGRARWPFCFKSFKRCPETSKIHQVTFKYPRNGQARDNRPR